jgi:cofilin
MSRGKTKFIIYKISDDRKSIVVEEVSSDPDYEVFRSKLENARDGQGNPAPRYAVYDVEYELAGGEGKR